MLKSPEQIQKQVRNIYIPYRARINKSPNISVFFLFLKSDVRLFLIINHTCTNVI